MCLIKMLQCVSLCNRLIFLGGLGLVIGRQPKKWKVSIHRENRMLYSKFEKVDSTSASTLTFIKDGGRIVLSDI